MKTWGYLWLICLCASGSGCTLAESAVHNAFLGPHELWTDHYEDGRNRALAYRAWELVCGEAPDVGADYREGFLEGYADYLKYGGNGEPPAVVPARYRGQQIRTGTGWSAASCWIAGFRHGARAAQASGQRLRPPTALSCGAMPLNPYGPLPIATNAPTTPAANAPAANAAPFDPIAARTPLLMNASPYPPSSPPSLPAESPSDPSLPQPSVPFSIEVVDPRLEERRE